MGAGVKGNPEDRGRVADGRALDAAAGFRRAASVPLCPEPTAAAAQELLAQPGMETLLTCGAMSKPLGSGEVNGVDPDHLVRAGPARQPCRHAEMHHSCGGPTVALRPPPLVPAPNPAALAPHPCLQFMTLLRADLLRDLLFLWNPRQRQLHTCMSVGLGVCGHPSIVHGGFTSGAPPAAACRPLCLPRAAVCMGCWGWGPPLASRRPLAAGSTACFASHPSPHPPHPYLSPRSYD